MKNRNIWGNYPFLTAVIISCICLTCLGLIGRNNIYSDYERSLRKAPMLSAVFEGISAGNYPWKIVGKHISYAKQKPKKNPKKSEKIQVIYNPGKVKKKTTTKDVTEVTRPDDAKKSNALNKSKHKAEEQTETIQNTDKKQKSKTKETPQTNTKSKKDNTSVGKYVKVSKSYFKDALFIGDSRTVGLSEYSGWKNTTYYADVGLTIYDVFDKKIVKMNGKKVTIEKALKKKHFKKIYIMLGINELGRGTTKTFISEYKKVIKRIQKLQPDAIIFVEGIMKVSKEKSDKDPIFNNKHITRKNKHLAKLADCKRVFYIDVNEVITDKSGNIPAKYTFDSIHLKAAYYKIWTDFLLKHGIE